jgi:hypothetical protein
VSSGVARAGGLATDRSGEVFSFRTQRDESLLKVLANLGATPDKLSRIAYTVADPAPVWLDVLLGIGPLVVFALLTLFAWRRFANRGGNPMQSFAQTRARVAEDARSTVTFIDVAGIDEPLQELQEVVEFLKEPQKFAKLGARIPHGVLLVGPPGTPSPAKHGCPSSGSRDQNSSRCSSASAPVVYAICSAKPATVHRASSSSTKLTRLVASAERDWATPMMNASKRSIRSWSKWTDLMTMPA